MILRVNDLVYMDDGAPRVSGDDPSDSGRKKAII